MFSFTCIFAWAVVFITLPIVLIFWITETKPQRICRWHSYGLSQRSIAKKLGITRYEVRKALAK